MRTPFACACVLIALVKLRYAVRTARFTVRWQQPNEQYGRLLLLLLLLLLLQLLSFVDATKFCNIVQCTGLLSRIPRPIGGDRWPHVRYRLSVATVFSNHRELLKQHCCTRHCKSANRCQFVFLCLYGPAAYIDVGSIMFSGWCVSKIQVTVDRDPHRPAEAYASFKGLQVHTTFLVLLSFRHNILVLVKFKTCFYVI